MIPQEEEEETIMRSVQGVFTVMLGVMVLASPAAMAGKNAGGAMVVHTNDACWWTQNVCYLFDIWFPDIACADLNTRTDRSETRPALIWFLSLFIVSEFHISLKLFSLRLPAEGNL